MKKKTLARSRDRIALRDKFSSEHLDMLLVRAVKPEPRKACLRDQMAILLLWVSGLRVYDKASLWQGELRQIKVFNLRSYFKGNVLDVQLSKSKSPVKHPVVASAEILKLFSEYKDIIKDFLSEYEDDDKPFYVSLTKRSFVQQLTRRIIVPMEFKTTFECDYLLNSLAYRSHNDLYHVIKYLQILEYFQFYQIHYTKQLLLLHNCKVHSTH